MALHRLIGSLRDATWFDGERARVYGTMLAIGLAALTLWVCLHPVAPALAGGDFLSFYAASTLALGGHAADVWRPDLHEAAEHAILPGTAGYLAFFYPPPFLLVCWSLALLPYALSFVTWAIGTTVLALAAVALFLRRAGGKGGLTSLALLAFPALWINIMTGQNGALSLALFAAGFALLPRRPVLAGLVLGLLIIKPQLAVALPFVLAA
ncbi:MAG: glycosyltransferase family 87 protein, partial [Devosia sp.]